jgi:glycosyltransferase involved in cell wall biosynthesis
MVTPRYLPHTGGVELHVHEVARRIAARGADVTILTADLGEALAATEYRDGVRVRRVHAWPAGRDYFFAPEIYREVARGGWNIVHVQSFHTLVPLLAMLAALRAGVPYVVTFHAGGHPSPVRQALRPIQLRLLRPLLRRADRLIALARFEIDQYSRRLAIPADRFALVPNGSDLPGLPGDKQPSREASLIASVGRLERHKGHQRVIAALPHVLRRRPNARLWIAGSGPYEPRLRQLAEALRVSERVDIRVVPIGERRRMAEELARVKVVVSLSEFETQPIALLEARAAGCRLVVADAPGLTPLAEEGLARSIPRDSSPGEIAAVILTELEQPSASTPVELPTWDESADALLELYESIGAGRRLA